MSLVVRSWPLALLVAAALIALAPASTAWATSTTPASALRTSSAETASTPASSSPPTASAPSGAQPKNRVRGRALGSGHRFVRQASAERGLASGIGARRRCGCVGPTSYGKEHDELTSLSYYGFRYYDRLTLSWTQADPLFRFVPDLAWDEPRRANLYSFSLNNPLRYIDPDGRDRDTDADAKVNRQIEKQRQEDEEKRKREEQEKYEKECVNTPIAAGNCPSVQARATFTGDIGPDVEEDVKQEAREELAADLSHRYATVAAVALTIADGAALVGVLRGVGAKLLGKAASESAIKFGQASVSNTFAHGPFKGRTIGEVADGLRSGRISPDQLPLDVVRRGGESVTINNRSLTALRRAGVEPTRVIDRTGNPRFEKLLDSHLRGGSPSDVIRIRGGSSNASLLE